MAVVSWLKAQLTTLRTASPLRWVFFLSGNFLVGLSIGGFILPSALGAGPADAVFAGAADVTPLTVGTWAILVSIALVAFAAALGTPPLLGTVFSFLLIGFFIDLFLALAPVFSSLPSSIFQWAAGILILAVGAGMTISSELGASAYDQATIALAAHVRRLSVARLILDACALVVAFALSGPIGWGTVALLLVFPLVMPPCVSFFGRAVIRNEALRSPPRT